MNSAVNQTMMYYAFGCRIESDIRLPELISAGERDGAPDIVIRTQDLSELWSLTGARSGKFNVRNNHLIFHLPGVAKFSVQDGARILVSPDPGSDPDEIRLYVLGTCMGALLLQRRILPLHGSAVSIGGKAYAFVGDSGAGKSTLASTLLQMGYPLVSDDVIAVSLTKENPTPYVIPAYPQQKLWQESLDHFGMDSSQYRPLAQRETKFSVPVSVNYWPNPLPLAGVFELSAEDRDNIEIKCAAKLESLPILYHHTFRNMLIGRFGLQAWHFETTAKLAGGINVYRIQRPVATFTAPDIASMILNIIKKDG